jgi:hypothetical protein
VKQHLPVAAMAATAAMALPQVRLVTPVLQVRMSLLV